jgi:adenylate cyclase
MSPVILRLRALYAELKRRKVVRVVVAYGIAAGAIIQIADAVVPALALPPVVLTVTVAAALAGLPLAVFLSWL